MNPGEQERSPDLRSQMTAAQVFASLDEERGSDPWMQIRSAGQPGQHEDQVERRGPRLIGIVSAVPDLPQAMHPFFGPVLAGIKARLVQARCDLLVPTYNPASPIGEDPRAIERCFAYGASGLIVMGSTRPSPILLRCSNRDVRSCWSTVGP